MAPTIGKCTTLTATTGLVVDLWTEHSYTPAQASPPFSTALSVANWRGSSLVATAGNEPVEPGDGDDQSTPDSDRHKHGDRSRDGPG